LYGRIDADGGESTVCNEQSLKGDADEDSQRSARSEDDANEAGEEEMNARRPDLDVDGGSNEERRRHDGDTGHIVLGEVRGSPPGEPSGRDKAEDDPGPGQDAIGKVNGPGKQDERSHEEGIRDKEVRSKCPIKEREWRGERKAGGKIMRTPFRDSEDRV
jgi:hypothetical protein